MVQTRSRCEPMPDFLHPKTRFNDTTTQDIIAQRLTLEKMPPTEVTPTEYSSSNILNPLESRARDSYSATSNNHPPKGRDREQCQHQFSKSNFGLTWSWPLTFCIWVVVTQWEFTVICAWQVSLILSDSPSYISPKRIFVTYFSVLWPWSLTLWPPK